MNARVLAATAAVLIASAADAGPSAADVLARCRTIDAPGARLACYDEAAGRRAASAETVAVPAAAPSPEAERATQTRNFGLTPAQVNPARPQGPEAISARITAVGGSTSGHASVTLDNGQVWNVADDASRLSAGDAVAIKRAALGSYLMTTADRHSYTVHRSR